ncbi:uncharacterized protein METZ01_LOCUS456564, partial [marine metagenome]
MNSEFSHSRDFQKALESLSGLEFMQKIAHGELPQPPMGKTLGFRVVEADSGKVIFEGEPNSSHYNPIGSVHGGFASVLLDSAMGCAVHTKLPAGIFYTTLELKINLVRAIQENTGMLRATGSVIHCGRRTATVESRLEDRSEKLYAHGTRTCLI